MSHGVLGVEKPQIGTVHPFSPCTRGEFDRKAYDRAWSDVDREVYGKAWSDVDLDGYSVVDPKASAKARAARQRLLANRKAFKRDDDGRAHYDRNRDQPPIVDDYDNDGSELDLHGHLPKLCDFRRARRLARNMGVELHLVSAVVA